jgi:hypothetical protein
MLGLGGVAQRSLGDIRALMDSHRTKASSGAMVASIVGPMRGFASVYQSRARLAGSGGGDFCGMRTRRYL